MLLKGILWKITFSFKYLIKSLNRFFIYRTIRHIKFDDAKKHIYLTWKTWCGKSSFIEQWIYWNWYKTRKNNNISIVIIDPHGDTAEKIRRFDLAKDYTDRLVYIDPFFSKWKTPCLNPMELQNRDEKTIELQTQQLVRVFEQIIPDAKLSNYMRAVIKPCVAILLQVGWTNLSHLQEFMSKTQNEKWVSIGKKSKNPVYRKFFQKEFENRIYDATKWSIYTKIQSLLNSSTFYNMTVGSSTINLEQKTRKWKIIVFNLSKGLVGEEVCETIGRLIIAQLKQIALSKANIPSYLRKPIFLIIDESDTFITKNESLNVILQEGRKYGLHLFLCSQNLIGWLGNMRLQRNILSNTSVKLIGINSVNNIKPLSLEINASWKSLLQLKQYELIVKSGDNNYLKLKTLNTLGHKSPLLLRKWEVSSLHSKMLNNYPYYKPILPFYPPIKDRIDDLPIDFHEELYANESPEPKFPF